MSTSIDTQTRQARCATHGEFTSRNAFGSRWTTCPSCAAEAKAAEDERRAAREKAEDARRWQKRLGHSCIPDRFRAKTLENYAAENGGQRRALKFARAFADNFDADALASGRGALFVGKPGTGKTHLACGIALQIMRVGRTVLFSTVMRAIRRIKDTWARGSSESETEAIAALTDPDLLILDEIGLQFGSETEQRILFDVMNCRYERRLPTLFLSNLDVDGVRAFLGERVFDRAREDGCEVVVFDWESHRGKVSP